jgi:hypothetical protein
MLNYFNESEFTQGWCMKKVILLAFKLSSWLEQGSSKLLPQFKHQVAPSFEDPLSCLYHLLGGEGKLPLAALQAHRYRLPPNFHWLLAEPIECQADTKSVYCLGSVHLDISTEESAQLLETLNAHISMDGLRLYAPTPQTWLLASDKPVLIDTVPLSQVLNRDIASCMPKHLTKAWKCLFLELEMLLHQHPVNQAREKAGKPKINACWFSAAGQLKAMQAQPKMAIFSDDPLAHTLGLWVNAQISTLSQDYAGALAACEKGVDQLMIMSASESLSDFEAQWLSPLMSALSKKHIHQVEIYAGDNVCYDRAVQHKRMKLPFF